MIYHFSKRCTQAMRVDFLNEPELEFGVSKHVDIRFGLMNYGPLDIASNTAPTQIKYGIVGTPETVEGVEAWFDRCKEEIPPKPSKQPNLFPNFPGFELDSCFHSTLVTDSRMKRTIPQRTFDELSSNYQPNQVISACVEIFLKEFTYLTQNTDVDVLICAVPINLAKLIFLYDEEEPGITDDDTTTVREKKLDFHDLLKARAMHVKKPIQLILPATYDVSKRIHQKQRLGYFRQLQDEATRAWNIHTALYYKAGGTPWRLVREPSELTVCYVGVSFYKSLEETMMLTSMAEVFNERGQGVIVRGGIADISKNDRRPHLSESDAHDLLCFALDLYKAEHHTLPARVVIHKTSKHNESEKEGFQAAIKEKAIHSVDLISVDKSFSRLFRLGAYPPLRGTLLHLDEKSHLIYTRGSVDFFSTYPGMYVPRPLIMYCDDVEQTPKFLAKEILALTKMNWNSTQFDNFFPITVEASRNVAKILRYIDLKESIEPRYSYYM